MIVAIIALLIPLVAIGGAYWLKFKRMELDAQAKGIRNQAGTSPMPIPEGFRSRVDFLEQQLTEVTKTNQRLTQRVQNLESIVTSPTFDAVVNKTLNDHPLPQAMPITDASQDERQAEEMARKLSRLG